MLPGFSNADAGEVGFKIGVLQWAHHVSLLAWMGGSCHVLMGQPVSTTELFVSLELLGSAVLVNYATSKIGILCCAFGAATRAEGRGNKLLGS